MSDYDYDDYCVNEFVRELCEQYSDECRERGDYDSDREYSSEDERDWRDYDPYYDENPHDDMFWYDRYDRQDEAIRAEEAAEKAAEKASRDAYRAQRDKEIEAFLASSFALHAELEAEEAKLAAECELSHQNRQFCKKMDDCDVCLKQSIISEGHIDVEPEEERGSWEEEYVEYCEHCKIEYYDGIGGRPNSHHEVTCVDCGDVFCYQRNLCLAYYCNICMFPSIKRCHRCVKRLGYTNCPECIESKERTRISAKAYYKRIARAQRRRCRRRKAKKAKLNAHHQKSSKN